MERIYAPWRMAYIEKNEELPGCFLCDYPSQKDDHATRILHRGENCFVILNIFPYNPGHLMVVPYRHVASYDMLEKEEVLEMGLLVQRALKVLRKAFSPQGFNVGMNLGRVAGAGCDGHVHMHVVPRWNGDTNFMPVLGDVRVVPQEIEATYRALKEAWESCGE